MLFSDPFREFDALTENLFTGRRASLKPIPMDVWKDEQNLHIQFDVPGVREDQINLEMEGGVLTLTVDRPVEEVAGERLINERSYGFYRRQLSLGEQLNLDDVRASLEHGVLKLTVPVAEKAKPKRIPILGGAGMREIQQSDESKDKSSA